VRGLLLPFAFALAAQVTKELPPPPPSIQATTMEDDALRAAVAGWNATRSVKTSPLVITRESFALSPEVAPYLRLELLRRGVPAALTEQLLTSLSERNVRSWSLESAALDGITRLRFVDILFRALDPKSRFDPALQNLDKVRAVTVPGTARESAIIFAAVGPEMLNVTYSHTELTFVEGGRVVWEQKFGKHDIARATNAAAAPHLAEFSTDDLGVIQALLDRRFPNRGRPPQFINETRMFDFGQRSQPVEITRALAWRNSVPLFIPAIALARPVKLVPRERLFVRLANELEGAPGTLNISLPAYSSDRQRAWTPYMLVIPAGSDIEVGSAIATLQRNGNGWRIISDDYRRELTTKIDPNVPARVGGDIKAPVAMKRVNPQFPPGTPAGTIVLEIVVDREGRVQQARVMKPLSTTADQAAIAAVRQWQFQSATLGGKPITVLYDLVLSMP